MSKNNFTRSNVNEQTLMVSEINRSGFDLSHRVNTTLKLGRLTPVNIERLLPTDIVQGSLSPKFQLENCGTPTIGKLRLDTHTFQVNMRRIHNGFRSFMEDNTNNNTLPSLCIPEVAANFIYCVCTYGSTSAFPNSPVDMANQTLSTIGMSGTETTIPAIAANIQTSYVAGLLALCQNGLNEYGWNKDFLALEWQRIRNLTIPNDATAIGFILYEIMRSLFGEGSVLDLLGYPIYNRLGAWYAAVTNTDISVSDWQSAKLKDVFTVCFTSSPSGTMRDFIPLEYYSEMPLRAIYAIYYDYFRDWHVEPRYSVLNPDNFGSGALTQFSASVMDVRFTNVLQLLVLRFRNFSRDFLTTVQVDDIYRHVYAPVFSNTRDVTDGAPANTGLYDASVSLPIGNGSTMDGVGNLTNILYDITSDVPFLGDIFYSRSSSTGTTTNGFIADLQTMRRTGMLEKWLARNYFFPDTYVGQLRAHYDVVPEDINYINCQYLGGTEQLVEGNQTIAPVDTPQMDAGTRTVVSGVNTTDMFSYRASDHCYIVSFVSLMPIVNYDIKNMHLKELRKMDIATPEFAQDSRVAIRLKDMLRGFDGKEEILGYVPRYYHYRVHGDETHGRYLNDYRSYSWFRDWYNMTFSDIASLNIHDNQVERGFVLSPYCLRVHLTLDAFNDKLPWDDIAFGSCDIQFFKNSPLPATVDII